MKEIKQGLDFNLDKVAGVLISHEHKDHCKSVLEVMEAGLNTYSSWGTWHKMDAISSHRCRIMHHMVETVIGEFKIIPFHVKHDAAEPFGFVIHHPECGTVLFVTDSYYVPNIFRGLNNIIIEANYDNDIVKRRLEATELHARVRDRVLESHMSIDTCIGLLAANDLSAVNNIVLIHLSDGNSNAADFQRQVQESTGKTVYVASKGMSIDFNKAPF
jgi:phosphoribosyl 1,2-cyclic phosphodiesterase